MSSVTISEAAEAVGLPPSTLRYYEDEELLGRIPRSPSGYRMYDERALARARFVGHAKRLGLPLDDIRDLAALWAGEDCTPVQHRLRELVRRRRADAASQQSALTAFAQELAAAERQLAQTQPAGSCGDDCACVTTVLEPGP